MNACAPKVRGPAAPGSRAIAWSAIASAMSKRPANSALAHPQVAAAQVPDVGTDPEVRAERSGQRRDELDHLVILASIGRVVRQGRRASDTGAGRPRPSYNGPMVPAPRSRPSLVIALG